VLLRAAFWIGLVAFLAPHPPIAGAVGASPEKPGAAFKDWSLEDAHAVQGSTASSSPASALLDRIQSSAVKTLDGLAAAIEEHEHSRGT